MRNLLICLFIGLVFTSMQAQKTHFIKLDNQLLKSSGFDFQVDEIFDGRNQKYTIGFVQKGLNNAKALAFFDKGLELEILALFTRSFAADQNPNHISIRVNHLEIHETTNASSEMLGTEINLSFLKKVGNDYEELYNVGVSLEKYAMEVTKWHEEYIAKAIDDCCTVFAKKAKEGTLWHRPFDLNINPDSLFMNYPIYQVDKPRKGFYHTLEDFRDNLPDTSRAFILEVMSEKSKNQVTCTAKWLSGVTINRKDDVAALCDGEHFYLKNGDYFYQLNKEKNRFSLLAKTPKQSNGGAGLIGGLVGGILGVIIANAIESSVNASRGELESYFINFQTSTLIPKSELKNRKTESRIVINCGKTKEMPPSTPIFINGKNIGNYEPGIAYKVHIPAPNFEISVCSGSETSDNCEKQKLDIFKTEYIEMTYRKGKFVYQAVTGDHINFLKGDIEDGAVILIDKEW
jgi:hypothetical protein